MLVKIDNLHGNHSCRLICLAPRVNRFSSNMSNAEGENSLCRHDAETLRAARPSLIHCSISGYGEDGPYAAKKAYDLLVQCETGLVLSTGTPETPSKAGFSVADLATGVYAYSGILAALYDRERTGNGATLRVSLLDALGELMMQPAYFSCASTSTTEPSSTAPAPHGPTRTCKKSCLSETRS